MLPDERIKKLEERVETLTRENGRLRKAQMDQHKLIKTAPQDKWYLIYLMQNVASLERQCEERQKVVEQYQKFFEKYGHFYHRLEGDIHRKLQNAQGDVV